mmetsp:Transcript_104718/g.249339  ORF Transcript_104718/g.249339 Transcript_104718/m.249339 type:complete len:450 (+) Transcript_104718:48-1397(+)
MAHRSALLLSAGVLGVLAWLLTSTFQPQTFVAPRPNLILRRGQTACRAAGTKELLFQPGQRVTLNGPPAMAGSQGTVVGPVLGNAFAVQFDNGSIFHIDSQNIEGSGAPPAAKIDYNAVRADLKHLMDDPNWDDGSYGPLLIRLAWHSSGTYSKYTNTGGSEGAAMRFVHGTESKDPENAGLGHAINYLQPIKDKYPLMSYSDMWILAAYVAIEHMGGPSIEFKPGRVDTPSENGCPEWDGPMIDGKASSRLPHAEYGLVEGFDRDKVLDSEGRILGWENLAQHMRDVFYRMGFNDREIVALMTGGHLWGRCHPEHSGYAGPWVEEMTKWSNEYAADMIEDPWRMVSHSDTWLDSIGAKELRPAPGKRQYVNKFPPAEGGSGLDDPNQMMLVADMVLLWDPVFRQTLEEYAIDDTGSDDNHALRRDFASAYKKLTELGTRTLTACPFAH